MKIRMLSPAFLLLGVSVGVAAPPPADDACAAFTWDVKHERSLFSQHARQLAAGAASTNSPTLTTDHLYQLQLKAQREVSFPRPPGKKTPDGAESYAGLARLTLQTGGVYRVALDQAIWIDAIANDSVIEAKDFQGRHGCNAPHKIVEFLLPARTPITLQFSGSHVPAVEVTVTRSPAG